MYLGNYGLRKRWLEKCLKTLVTDDTSTSNMVNGPKHCCILDDSILTIFIDHCGIIELQKVSFSTMKNLKTVC